MAKTRESLWQWAKRTSTSFAEMVGHAGTDADRVESVPATNSTELIYRLRLWPELPERHKSAAVFRALSVMSNRPVNRSWILRTTKMKEQQVDSLLAYLVASEAVDIVDPARF